MFEMDEEYSESDIPTVLIRSKADCPVQEVRLCVGVVAGIFSFDLYNML